MASFSPSWYFFLYSSVLRPVGVAPIKDSSVLHLQLEGSLPDRANNDPFANFNPLSFGVKAGMSMGLFELKQIIEHAKNDDKIKGIFLNAQALSASTATLEEVRNYLLDFKTSGKFIVSYADFLPRGRICCTV